MARNTVQEWDQNPDLNTDIAGINIAENCPPSGINDAIRRIMGQVAVWAQGVLLKAGGAMTGALTDMGAASSVKDGTGVSRPLGYRNIPGRVATTATTIAVADAGGKIKASAGVTVPLNADVPFPIDDGVVIVNNTPNQITISPAGSVVLRLAGGTTAGARTLAAYGRAFLSKEGTDEWHIAGAGVS